MGSSGQDGSGAAQAFMTVLIDTNVVVDVLTRREPFFSDSARVLDAAKRGQCSAWLCATTVTTVFYLVRRHLATEDTVARIRDLTSICQMTPVTQAVLDAALESGFADFEDAVLNHAALMVGADCIVTRNEPDFQPLLIYSPRQFMAALAK